MNSLTASVFHEGHQGQACRDGAVDDPLGDHFFVDHDLPVLGELRNDDQAADQQACDGGQPCGKSFLLRLQRIPDQHTFAPQVAEQHFRPDKPPGDGVQAEAFADDLGQAQARRAM